MATFEELGIEVKYGRTGNQKVKCPNCSHTRKHKTDKSLSVNMTDKTFNCHNCGWSGRATDLTEFELKQQKMEYRKQYSKPDQKTLPLTDKVINWFKGRGIEERVLEYFKVSESVEWMPEKGKQAAGRRNTINFNYYRGTEKVNIKYRDGVKAFKMVKEAELIFYNINTLKGRTDALICEGEIDCMTFYQCGHYGTVSVPNGASKGNARLEYVDNCIDDFEGIEKIVIAVDGDEAGEFLKNELARRFGKHRCWFVKYPEGCKDANEVLLKYGPDAVRKLWESAEAPPIEQILSEEDMVNDLYDVYQNGYPQTDPIGFPNFDLLLRFARGEVTTITGIPGHGKGEFIDQITVRLAARYGWRIGVFSFEEPFLKKGPKICSKFVGEKFFDDKPANRMNELKLKAAAAFLIEHYYFIDIKRETFTIDAILAKARELVMRKGISALIIDPYTCIESSQPKDQTETQYIGEIMGKITRFAESCNVHVFFVVHPTKMDKDASGNFKVPNLYNCAGSANFFNKTHNGLCVYRDLNEGTTKIFVQKVKFSWNGKLGHQDFIFDVDTGRYAEVGTIGGYSREIEYYQQRLQSQIEPLIYDPPEPTNKPASPAQPDPNPLNNYPPPDLSKWSGAMPPEEVPF